MSTVGRIRSVVVPLSVLCLVTIPVGSRAQLLRGRVLDAAADEVVAAAEVWIRTSQGVEVAHVLSDENGLFGVRLDDVRLPAILLLSVRRIGYDSTATTSLHVEAGEDMRVDLRIRARPVELPRIEVEAQRLTGYLTGSGFYSRQKMGFGAFRDELAIDSLHPTFTHDLFRGLRGVRLAVAGTGDYEPVISRGGGMSGTCPMTVWLDGTKIRSSSDKFTRFLVLDMLIQPEHVGGFELYRGPAETPPQYRDDAVCGVLVIWSRR